MTIKYPNGKTVEAALLTRNGNTMRVVLEDGEDVAEFIEAQGNWVSEALESVEITFEWQKRVREAEEFDEANFICSPDLAGHLIQLLELDSEEPARPKYMTAGFVM